MFARRTSEDLKEVIRDFRRDQVIDVARRLFGERGTTDVSMDEIASEAGVARSTVYVYFANRDELLRACLQRMHNQLVEAVATSWREDSDPTHRLTRLIEEMLARVDDNPAFFRLALVTQVAPTDGAEAVGSELALIGLAIAGLIRDLVVDGIERANSARSTRTWPPRSSASRSTGRWRYVPRIRHHRTGHRQRRTPSTSSCTA